MVAVILTDALAELTLLEKRIQLARANMESNKLIAIVEVVKAPIGFRSREEYITQACATPQ